MFYQGLLKFAVHFYNLTFNNRSYNLVFETEELSDARKKYDVYWSDGEPYFNERPLLAQRRHSESQA